MVVDDEVVNKSEKSGLKLATPPGVKLSILPPEAAANILLENTIANFYRGS